MPHDRGKLDKLAAWVAAGRSIAAFAKHNEISTSTCYSWTKRDDFKARVARIRQRMLDRIGGTLTSKGLAAVESMVKLSKGADSDAVKLAAAKAILDKMVDVMNQVEFDRRLKALEDGGKPDDSTRQARSQPPQDR
jgi:hypothetical protein